MTPEQAISAPVAPVRVTAGAPGAQVLLVCEHASNHVPQGYELGISEAVRASHVAWDPGAGAVAAELAALLGAPLVSGGWSRLIYDCNRPPQAPDAVPARSEIHDIPGNAALDAAGRAARAEACYGPFRATLAGALEEHAPAALVTVHSFTPVFDGRPREVEIGVLHDEDTRLADAMMALAPAHAAHEVRRNQPYGPEDGVTHTLREHALPRGALNVMLEIRNDLIATEPARSDMAAMLADWLRAALGLCGLDLPAEADRPAQGGAAR